MALIAEKEKAIYLVANPAVRNHFAEHIRVSATLDRGELYVNSVVDLGDYQGPGVLTSKDATVDDTS